jgi:hypothetical protein
MRFLKWFKNVKIFKGINNLKKLIFSYLDGLRLYLRSFLGVVIQTIIPNNSL